MERKRDAYGIRSWRGVAVSARVRGYTAQLALIVPGGRAGLRMLGRNIEYPQAFIGR